MSMSKAKAENRPLPKRFYEDAGVVPDEGGHLIALDGRPVKTPARRNLAAPNAGLAQAIAAEWAAQEDEIDPSTMPLTRLAHVAIDRMPEAHEAVARDVARFAATDLLCHRSDDEELARRQAEEWDPLLRWAETALDAPLKSTSGVLALEQPEASLAAIEAQAKALDDWRLTGVASSAPILGSIVLAFAMLHEETDAASAFSISRLEEHFQNERWGEDAEAAERAAAMLRDLMAVERLFRLMDEAEG